LERAKVAAGAKHVWFEGLDDVEQGDHTIKFGGSIPLARVMESPRATAPLVAYRMNDAALTPDHGFPLRMIVPGYIGARSVKWLGKIVVSDKPSPNHFLAEAYKLVQTSDAQELAKADPIYENVVNAVIGAPTTAAKTPAGEVEVAGYALPSGSPGATIKKVEISHDGGEAWQPAQLGKRSEPDCWRLWSLKLKLPRGKHALLVRATDSAGETMPEKSEWNAKGYLFNAWHRVEVEAT
jgi:sulfite oxidase